MVGALTVSSPATVANSSIIGSISGEWKACETASRCTLRPSARSCSATALTASWAPEITTDAGPLMAAMLTWAPSRGSTSSSVACTAIIAPPSGSACMSRPRAATSTAAFSSDKTPATWAADNSPTECPITKSGRTPQDSSSRYNATSTANSAGWANSVVLSRFSSWPQMTSRSGRNRWRSSSPTTVLNASAKTGYPACSPMPIPSSWEPWPGKTNTVLPAAPATPRITEAPPNSSPANSSSPASNPSRSAPSTTARCSKVDRPANDHPTSATSSSS